MKIPYWQITVVSAIFFIVGATLQDKRINRNMMAIDQSAYLEDAKAIRQMHFAFVGGRNRMPLYPGLMSLFYKPGMTDSQFFAVGKKVGVGLSLLVLLAALFIFSRYIRFFHAFLLIHIAAFTVFVYKAPYFQT